MSESREKAVHTICPKCSEQVGWIVRLGTPRDCTCPKCGKTACRWDGAGNLREVAS